MKARLHPTRTSCERSSCVLPTGRTWNSSATLSIFTSRRHRRRDRDGCRGRKRSFSEKSGNGPGIDRIKLRSRESPQQVRQQKSPGSLRGFFVFIFSGQAALDVLAVGLSAVCAASLAALASGAIGPEVLMPRIATHAALSGLLIAALAAVGS